MVRMVLALDGAHGACAGWCAWCLRWMVHMVLEPKLSRAAPDTSRPIPLSLSIHPRIPGDVMLFVADSFSSLSLSFSLTLTLTLALTLCLSIFVPLSTPLLYCSLLRNRRPAYPLVSRADAADVWLHPIGALVTPSCRISCAAPRLKAAVEMLV